MDKVYYYNRNGQLRLTIGEGPFYMVEGTGEFKNHGWGYEQKYGKIKGLYRNKESYPFSIVITSGDKSDHDKLCDVFDDDVIAGKPGYFIINGWRLDCIVLKAEHSFFSGLDRVIAFEAISEGSTWIRKKMKSYNGTNAGMSRDVDYGRDYTYTESVLGRGYDYGYNQADSRYDLIRLAGSDNGFEAVIYGPQDDPVIYLDNYPVKVNVSIGSTERLRIVSNGAEERTITILSADGTERDAFIYRDKENTPFISMGSETELTYGEIKFDFTTIERRSEPSWT
ncbi:MAG: hypothetical protein IJ820_08145 [Lachnospiraceae bacterium]|nr:hypothetical protein [Mogibacterium sp.]MBR1901012.1 hypothetical protein [Lachnospiraceae bacterium]